MDEIIGNGAGKCSLAAKTLPETNEMTGIPVRLKISPKDGTNEKLIN